jgi:hypothetical protein
MDIIIGKLTVVCISLAGAREGYKDNIKIDLSERESDV